MGEDDHDARERATMDVIRERVRALTTKPGPGAQTDRRRPGPKRWPECDCLERCDKPSCLHQGGRELAKEAASLSVVGRKHSPERMGLFLRKLLEFPNVTKACALAGFTYPTLRYWLMRSEVGRVGDGYDIVLEEEPMRFHEAYLMTRDAAVQMVEDAYVDRAMRGYYETLHDKGRVIYQYDEELLALGFPYGPEAYLRDADGKPIPERIHHQDPDVMLAVLKAWRRDRYGQHQQLDVTHKGGVLVVGVRAKDSAEIEAREKAYLQEAVDVEFRDVEEDDK